MTAIFDATNMGTNANSQLIVTTGGAYVIAASLRFTKRGNIKELTVSMASGAAGGSTGTITIAAGTIPPLFCPAVNTLLSIPVRTAVGATATGSILVGTDGSAVLSSDASGAGTFTNGAIVGIAGAASGSTGTVNVSYV